MKNTKEIPFQRFTVYILVAVLFAFAGSVIGARELRISVRYFHLDNVFTKFILKEAGLNSFNDPLYKTIQINWAEQYPFKRENVFQPRQQFLPLLPPLWNIVRFAEDFKKRILRYMEDFSLFHEKYVKTAIVIEKTLGLSFISAASYAILDDDYLVGYLDPTDVRNCAKSLTDFNHFLQSRNIPLLYVQAPDKVCKDDAIASTRNFSNQNADNLLAALRQTGVPVLDLREELHRQGLVHHDLFFKTDHHWKPETGLWATSVVAERLNASFDFNIDKSLYDPKHYEYYFQDGFLGSIGKRASLAVATPESISFIFPKFETDLTIRIPSRKLDKCGDFQITYKYNEKLREYAMQEKNVYDSSLYSLYSWGDDAVVFMHNNQLKSPKKILIIRDSFNCVVAPFLILGIKDLITLDLRSFTGSIRSFVDQNVPDIVLVFYYPNIISDLIENNPQRSFFDFR